MGGGTGTGGFSREDRIRSTENVLWNYLVINIKHGNMPDEQRIGDVLSSSGNYQKAFDGLTRHISSFYGIPLDEIRGYEHRLIRSTVSQAAKLVYRSAIHAEARARRAA